MASKTGEDTHEVRKLKHELTEVKKAANEKDARQGRTIHSLRCKLAEARELISKADRGELRRLERFEELAKEQFALDASRLENAHERIKLLQGLLNEQDAPPVQAAPREEATTPA